MLLNPLFIPSLSAIEQTPPEPLVIPLYARVVFFGDGVMSSGACPGLRNAPLHFLMLMNGRVRPAVGHMQCISGGDLDTIYARRANAIKQQPDLFFFCSQGHNDGLISSSWETIITKWERNLQACIDELDDDVAIAVCTTIKSTVSAETSGGDWQTIVNNAQKVIINNMKSLYGNRIVLVDTYAAYSDPANMAPASDSGFTHPDERGGYVLGLKMFEALDPYVVAATKDDILNDISAKTWRGANIHADNTFSGTSGTKSGTIAPTGTWPTGQRITNNLTNGTSVGVACTTPSSTIAQAVVTGTPASENNIILDDTAAFNLTGGIKGAFFEWREGILIDDGANGAAGIDNIALIGGSLGTIGSTATGNTVHSAPYSRKIDTILSVPLCLFGAGTPPTLNPQLAIRYRAVSQNSRIQISKPAVFQIEKEPYAPMYYLGDDGVFAGSFRVRATGTGVSGTTINAATVGTITMEPGAWSGGASDWNTVFTREMKVNGVVVSGAFASGWTYNATGTLTAGQTVEFTVTANNGLGSPASKTTTYTVI